MKKILTALLFLACFALPAQAAEELKEYLIKGMTDYELSDQRRNFEQLTINSTASEDNEIVKTTYEGNLVYSSYNYEDSDVKPTDLQALRYYRSAVNKLGGETLWEEGNELHASFTRNDKQYYMTVASYNGGHLYVVNILEVADLEYDVKILDDETAKDQNRKRKDYLFSGMPGYTLEQEKGFGELAIRFAKPETEDFEETNYEGNLVRSSYNYEGNAVYRPSCFQISRNYMRVATELGGEILWEDGNEFHASFTRDDKQYYMTVASYNGDFLYIVNILEVAELDFDVDILEDEIIDDPEIIEGEENLEEPEILEDPEITM